MTERMGDPVWMPAVLLLAMGALGIALALSEWTATTVGFALTALAFVLVLVAVTQTVPASLARRLPTASAVIAPVVLALFFFALWRNARSTPIPYIAYDALLVAAGILAALAFKRKGKDSTTLLLGMIAVFAVIGGWRIVASPSPAIDVWVWHREALDALFAGKNPYAMTMSNIYGPSGYYAPDLLAGDRVLVGYQYPPLSLFLAIPGYLIGDYRYSLLVASASVGLALGLVRSSAWSTAAATLWLFSQSSFFVIQFGWTDTFVVLFLALTVVAAQRRSKWTFVALGLFFASKQYAVLAAPLVFLLPISDGPPSLREHLKALAGAAAVALGIALPFIVWDRVALFRDLVTFQVLQPFRPESLSLPGWMMTAGGGQLPAWLGFASLVPTTIVALWKRQVSSAGFATAVALVYVTFFALSKQAFVNYYIFVFGALAIALAHADSQPRTIAGSS